jgi:hypothetical protein
MKNIISLILLLSAVAFTSVAQIQRVIIIRHAEKPDKGPNLSCKGLNRATALVAVLHKKFGTPNEIYVPFMKEGKSAGHTRMYETIMPFAVKYNLRVNSKYTVSDAEGLANGIMKKKGTALVVWEHKNIAKIVRAFGIKDETKWAPDDFDSILILDYRNGKFVMSRDRENISPSADCL